MNQSLEPSNGEQRQRVITRRYEFTGPYAGFWVDLDADPTMATFEDFSNVKGTDYGRVLAALTVASNVTDRAGAPLDLCAAESWRQVNRGLVEQAYGFVGDLFTPLAAKTTSSPTPSSSETNTEAAASPGATSA
jgi:hypothetical protein